MKLVTGGAYQRKREAACDMFGYSLSDFVDGALCGLDEIQTCRAMDHFHIYVRRCLAAERTVEELPGLLQAENPDILIVTDEIGCGVVPIEKEERIWREQTGRVCCELARLSDVVVRVTAGIPTVIKGSV